MTAGHLAPGSLLEEPGGYTANCQLPRSADNTNRVVQGFASSSKPRTSGGLMHLSSILGAVLCIGLLPGLLILSVWLNRRFKGDVRAARREIRRRERSRGAEGSASLGGRSERPSQRWEPEGTASTSRPSTSSRPRLVPRPARWLIPAVLGWAQLDGSSVVRVEHPNPSRARRNLAATRRKGLSP